MWIPNTAALISGWSLYEAWRFYSKYYIYSFFDPKVTGGHVTK